MVVRAAAVVAVLRSANAEWVAFARRDAVSMGATPRKRWGAAPAGKRLRRSGRSRAAVAAGTTGGAGDLPACRQRLQHADVTAGDLDIAATLKFSEDAIDHVA